jgi:hypothetical protein
LRPADHLSRTFDLELEAPRAYEAPVYAAPAGVVVEGTVRDPKGAPVASARVGIHEKRQPTATAQTKPDGTFRLEKVPPGTYVLVAAAQGFAQTETEEFTLQPGQPPPPFALKLGEGGTIRGKVSLASGAAVPPTLYVCAYGRSLATSGRAPRDSAWARVSPTDGTFELKGLEPGVWDVRAWMRGDRLACRPETVEMLPGSAAGAGETKELALACAESWGLSGRLLEPGGKEPLREVAVEFSDGASPYQVQWREKITTDGAGRYELSKVPGWLNPVVVKAEGRAKTLVTLGPDEGRDRTLDIVLNRGAAVRGQITKHGAPLAEGAYVVATQGPCEQWQPVRSSYYSDARSRRLAAGQTTYELSGLGEGLWTVGMWGDGFAPPEPREIQVRGQETITVDLEPTEGGSVAGKVTDVDGTPVGRTVLSGSAWGRRYFRDLGRTAGDGSFLLEHLPAGRNRIMARPSAQAGCSTLTAWVDVVEGKAVTCDLPLKMGWPLSGKVQGPTGRPPLQPGLFVASDGPTCDQARVEPDGSFHFEDLAPGDYALLVFQWGAEQKVLGRQEGVQVRENSSNEGIVVKA